MNLQWKDGFGKRLDSLGRGVHLCILIAFKRYKDKKYQKAWIMPWVLLYCLPVINGTNRVPKVLLVNTVWHVLTDTSIIIYK